MSSAWAKTFSKRQINLEAATTFAHEHIRSHDFPVLNHLMRIATGHILNEPKTVRLGLTAFLMLPGKRLAMRAFSLSKVRNKM